MSKTKNNLPLWIKVFDKACLDDRRMLNFDVEKDVYFEAQDSGLYPRVYVLGVFKNEKHGMLAVSFYLEASHDTFGKINIEFRNNLDDFTTISFDEKINIMAYIRSKG